MTEKNYIDYLVSLEPAFDRGSKLALAMQKDVVVHKNLNTGIAEVDIVTESDIMVQESVLAEVLNTSLAGCRLFAEESTPSVSKFKGTNGYLLTLDPIDGTAIYVRGGSLFSIIVTLFHGNRIIYSYFNYPAVGWSRRMTAKGIVDFGTLPQLPLLSNIDGPRTIAYTIGNPKEAAPEIYNELISKGYVFRQRSELVQNAGSSILFYLKKVAGYYIDHPQIYDGLGVYQFAQVQKIKLLSENIDLAHFVRGPYGFCYPGWYLAMW